MNVTRVAGNLIRTTLVLCVTVSICTAVSAQSGTFEGPVIDYLNAEVNDPVAQLDAKLAAGEAELKFDDRHGYLRSVLAALDIPISSQTLVFSKTSLQLHQISPRRPRAIYFNDEVYVGWCQRGDVLEFAATDARQGATFYTLTQDAKGVPRFVRDRGQCLSCHASSRTQDVPGYLIRSVFADGSGYPILGSGTYTTDHTSPFSERWGGWYVTGDHGRMRHMGNKVFRHDDPRSEERESGANRMTLDELVSTEAYLTPHSDLVALMVLEHQTQMHNVLAVANYETRLALAQSSEMDALLGRPSGQISESAERRIHAAAQRVVNYLLMKDEFQLENPVSGASGFAEEFAARGVRAPKGRSLRDLDLKQRLFRYPCSYMIHSAAFDGLPKEVRSRIIAMLVNILQGHDDSSAYAHLTAEMRREILGILRQTKEEFRIPLYSARSARM
jgi:hypothetical protein